MARLIARSFACVLVAFLLLPVVSYAQASAQAVESFIEALGTEAISVLQKRDLTEAQRQAAFRKLFLRGFDVDRIARLVLGRYWPRATEEERREYLQLFEDFVIKSYAGRLGSYTAKGFSIRKSVAKNDRESLVQTVIERQEGASVRVDWRINSNGKEHKIVDVVVEGVSMLVTHRSEFASIIRNDDGRLDALLALLRKRNGTD